MNDEIQRNVRPISWVLFALLASYVASVSCSARRGPPRPVAWVLRSPEAFFGDFMLYHEIEIRYGETERTMQAVLQLRGDTLTLIGLTPFGTRAFVLRQQGDSEPEFTNYLSEDNETRNFGFDPRFILVDIQRTFIELIDGHPPENGERSACVGEEELVELWRDGRLLERRFRQRGRAERVGQFVVSYGAEGYRFGEEPSRIDIRNERLGYELTLRTLSFQEL